MFDKPLTYKFVQRNKHKQYQKTYRFEYIYKFFIEDSLHRQRRKLIVKINQYSDTHFTVDFYATTSNKEKAIRNQEISPYRYLTGIGRANRVAATVFAIIGELRLRFPQMSFGFQGASLLSEESNNSSRRYRVYLKMMQLVTGAVNSPWQAFGYPEDSYIFVLQRRFLDQKSKIIADYGRIFDKVFEDSQEESTQSGGSEN